MIELRDVRKTYRVHSGAVRVLRGVDLLVDKGDKLGIVGRNGAGKSTLIRIIGDIEAPSSGTVSRNMRVSWPLGFTGAFQGTLTGIDNVRFICRVYEKRFEDVIGFVEEFSQLGRFLKEPVKIYSSGMRARLAFAISLMIDFDCYLIDEVIAVGDARFIQKCQDELFERRKDRALIIVSHDIHYLRDHCDRACVLADGRLHEFADVEDAILFHREAMAA